MRLCDICQNPIPDKARRGTKRCSEECKAEATRRRTSEWRVANKDKVNSDRKARRNGQAPDQQTQCPVCGTTFSDNRRKYCSDICSQQQVAKKNAEWRASRSLLQRRGERHHISGERFLQILEAQKFCCAGCKQELDLDTPKMVHIDHDHSCCQGRVSCGTCIRGILCFKCNTALGMVDDDITKLQGLIDYLTESTYLSRF